MKLLGECLRPVYGRCYEKTSWQPPWTVGPRLIGLWDIMKGIKAERSYSLGRLSGEIDGTVTSQVAKDRQKAVPKSTKDKFKIVLEEDRIVCEEANLRISVLAIDELVSNLQINESFTFDELNSALRELSNTVRRELLCITVL